MNNSTHPLTKISFQSNSFATAIEASAGTGKTWTIERLFIKALLEKSAEKNFNIKSILVVTFTKAAAAELRARILHQLKNTISLLVLYKNNKLIDDSDLFVREFILCRDYQIIATDIAVLTRAAQLFDQASIFTIHGFCQKIIKDYPLECKVSLPFEIMTDNEDIISELVHSFYREQILNNPLFSDNLQQVITNLESLFKADYSSSIIQKIYNKLPKDLLEIDNNQYRLKYQSDDNAGLKIFSAEKIEVSQGLKVLITKVSQYIIEHYPKYRKLSKKISFDELIQLVADAVLNSNRFADKLYTAYPVAFIDEFQDTDIKQWEIFSAIYQLTATKRGNLIVVGDPKQAIYRFRGADIDTYIHAVHNEIRQTSTLSENRRSHPHIMNFINQLFAEKNLASYPNILGNGILYDAVTPCVAQENLLELPSHKQLNQIANNKGLDLEFYDEKVQIIAFNHETYRLKNGEDYILNAMTLEILTLLHARPTLKGKIAILVTRNQEASKIVNFMRQFGIKASELKLTSIFATTTALELLNIIRAIVDLSNINNFNSAISGRIFNFELNKLANKEQYISEFETLYANFFKYQRLFNHAGIMSLIYELVADSAQQKNPISHRDLANFFQLGEILHKNSTNFSNNYDLIHWFNKKILDSNNIQDNDVNSCDNEELIRLDNDDEQILITTQHKSKGLEFDILFCPYFKAEDKYFNKNGEVDGKYLTSRMPRYITQRVGEKRRKNKIVLDNDNAQLLNVSHADNAEIQRLNYVSLTRAKSRLYIYLTPTRLNAKKTSYSHNSKTPAIHKLFGFNCEDPNDNQHNIFDYAAIFNRPDAALKRSDLLPGVVIYHRLVRRDQLKRLRLLVLDSEKSHSQALRYVSSNKFMLTKFEQSYSSIVQSSTINEHDYYCADDLIVAEQHERVSAKYRYNILDGAVSNISESISGAKFGLLYHELCENYPLNALKLRTILLRHNVPEHFSEQCLGMVSELFNKPLFPDGTTLAQINASRNYQTEFEFYMIIKNKISFISDVTTILAKNYGTEHPYTQACSRLGNISPGFLKGFIDLLFEHQGKFWVLDYKTNTLDSYRACSDDNLLIDAMAHHNYYLQFILYLVATKRHLEFMYNINDASELLGGAIYLFVRGFYLENSTHNDGILIDTKCIAVVKEVDLLLGGVVYG